MNPASIASVSKGIWLQSFFKGTLFRDELEGDSGWVDTVAKLVMAPEVGIDDLSRFDYYRLKQIPKHVVELVIRAIDRLVVFFWSRLRKIW